MDKLKVQAEQVAKQAQQGMAQGQTKIGEMQAKRAADALLHDLGAAVYAAQRQGGPHEPIETIMAALDAHAAAHGAIDTANTPPAPAPGAPAAADGSPAPAPPTPGPTTPS
ncbi:MAG: hypothetical protein QOF39_826, partial [Frankiales bacterium]|nr:hypothetical protein [Frankiales bacterium]